MNRLLFLTNPEILSPNTCYHCTRMNVLA
jgi:hypothetical protein